MSSRAQSKYKEGKKGFLSTKKVINHAKSLSTRALKGISCAGPARWGTGRGAGRQVRGSSAGRGSRRCSRVALLPASVRLRDRGVTAELRVAVAGAPWASFPPRYRPQKPPFPGAGGGMRVPPGRCGPRARGRAPLAGVCAGFPGRGRPAERGPGRSPRSPRRFSSRNGREAETGPQIVSPDEQSGVCCGNAVPSRLKLTPVTAPTPRLRVAAR